MIDQSLLKIHPAVSSEIENQKPVVALESTVIAHGLPRPINLETARKLESIACDAGATPATIAMLDGVFHIGLDDSELEFLAKSDSIHKLSTRDLPIAVAKRWNGATTVATTIWAAERADIHVFATGGIGGVHRGISADVSADLPQLAQSSMIVVCAGVKIVLDLPATREWLETNGVTILGFQCDEMPGFYSRSSGLPVDVRADSVKEVVEIHQARKRLGMRGCTLVTVPVPIEDEVDSVLIESALNSALAEAERFGVAGRDLTPYLLSRLSTLSNGATLRANIALLENNVRVAAEIACAL
jgi:pseudouridine-5'-phosphate glycosidase